MAALFLAVLDIVLETLGPIFQGSRFLIIRGICWVASVFPEAPNKMVEYRQWTCIWSVLKPF